MINHEQLNQALNYQQEHGGRIGSILVEMKYIDEENFLNFLSLYFDVPQIDLRKIRIDKKTISILPEERVRNDLVIPVKLIQDAHGREVLMLGNGEGR